MGLISLTLPNDGETIDAADVNTPFNTISTVINGNIDNANIKTNAAIDGTKIADNSIPASKMLNGAQGWTGLANNPNTITYNGNRNYDLVFNSVDLSNTLSPGMRLKLSRTVAAPTQCTDLESGSSQYYSKTSPAGLTFTTTWTAMAWVKLESYALGGIIARRNADTEGWSLAVNASGQLVATSLRIASNNSDTVSYASLPLNKWVHVAAATDLSGTTLMYIDGVLAPSATTVTGTAATLVQGTTALVVGARKSAGTDPFDGKIAQAAVFSTKLSAATIASYASQTLSGSETSLISAYSFNGVITDLNTTNANNLTAQGSAVATNTDSPYANAVTAGTEEYAIVHAVTYSTNTTVNVQVPEGCAVPTSGGIANVYYSNSKVPYGFVSNAGRWRLETLMQSQTLVTLAANNTWYVSTGNGGGINVPIGAWKIGYEWNIVNQSTVGGNRSLFCALASSTPSTTYTINALATHPVVYGSGVAMVASLYKDTFVNLTSATTYNAYFASDAITGTDTTGFNNGGYSVTFAENAYL